MNPTQEKTALIYVRVSTKRQTTDRQIRELKAEAKAEGFQVIAILQDKVSGAVPLFDRRNGRELLYWVEQVGINAVFISEISRLGRRMKDVTRAVLWFESNKVDINYDFRWYSYETAGAEGLSDFRKLLDEAERAEREYLRLSKRIKSGLAASKKKSGRPKGKANREKFLKKHSDIVQYLAKELSIREVARLSGKGVSTVQRVKKQL